MRYAIIIIIIATIIELRVNKRAHQKPTIIDRHGEFPPDDDSPIPENTPHVRVPFLFTPENPLLARLRAYLD